MAQAKYKQYYQKMMAENEALFARFRQVHEQYRQNKAKHQPEFDQIGQKVTTLIRDWDKRLCSAMGKTRYAHYSHAVSEKFWNLVREEFDQIDMVGVKIEQ